MSYLLISQSTDTAACPVLFCVSWMESRWHTPQCRWFNRHVKNILSETCHRASETTVIPQCGLKLAPPREKLPQGSPNHGVPRGKRHKGRPAIQCQHLVRAPPGTKSAKRRGFLWIPSLHPPASLKGWLLDRTYIFRGVYKPLFGWCWLHDINTYTWGILGSTSSR